LRALLSDWGALPETSTPLTEADLNGDGQLDLVLAVIDPASDPEERGAVLIFHRQGTGYQLAYADGMNTAEPLYGPALLKVADVNRDKRVEVAYTTTTCGAHTCFTSVLIVAWDGKAYRSLTARDITLAYPDIRFEDRSGDGVQELVLYGGVIGSIGAGPQRARTEIYKWNGSAYALNETIFDPSNYLYFKIVDANAALLKGHYTEAITLYRQAIDDTRLETWLRAEERAELAPFARFRLVLAYALAGDVKRARAAKDELLARHASDIYAQVVKVFWDAYAPKQDVRAACQTVTRFAQSHPATTNVLSNYGYANPGFAAAEVCPVGGG